MTRLQGPGPRVVRWWSLFIASVIMPIVIPAVIALEVALYVHRRKRVRL